MIYEILSCFDVFVYATNFRFICRSSSNTSFLWSLRWKP